MLLPVQPNYQVTLSGSLFGNDPVGTVFSGFSKYNQHSHAATLPGDPRLLDVRNGKQIFVSDVNGNPAFPDNTKVEQVTDTVIQADAPANKTVSGQTLFLLDAGQDPVANPDLLETAPYIPGVITIEGGAEIAIDKTNDGAVTGDYIDRWSRFIIQGSVSLFNASEAILIPTDFLSPSRLLGYRLLVRNDSSKALTGSIDANVKRISSGGTYQDLSIANLPATLNGNNSYETEVANLSPASDVIAEDEGLVITTSNDSLSSGSTATALDMESFDSIADLVSAGLGEASLRLQYWLEMAKVVVPNA